MRSSSSISPDNSTAAPTSLSPIELQVHQSSSKLSNLSQLLARREISPRSRRYSKQYWGKSSKKLVDTRGIKENSTKDVRHQLFSWAEAESLLHLSAKYCPLQPPPRSTIAAAFSPDGKTLASTHGDHTVKIIDCQTGKCLKVLGGHLRTPWVVRFHPIHPDVIASGSLDNEVRLWNAKTAECIGSRDFTRPIASLAFHAQGEYLAVASGHKLYIWHYNGKGEASSPIIILKTRRSLRAVHFHPHGAPFLLTAEVNDLDSSDPSMTLATSAGYMHYPPPTIYLADAHSAPQPSSENEPPIMSIPFLIWSSISQGDRALSSQHTQMDAQPSSRLHAYSITSDRYELDISPMESDVHDEPQNNLGIRGTGISHPPAGAMDIDLQNEELNNSQFGDSTNWELPFLQGWLIGQSQGGQRPLHSQNGRSVRRRSSHPVTTAVAFDNDPSERNHRLFMSQVQSEVAASLVAAATTELPCTVKLRIWSHDVKNPCEPLDTERCRLTIPHAVLCSEMGAHFSPCGRFLAVCVACILPNMDTDLGFHSQLQHDVAGVSTSPTSHPISSNQVIYELRIYSLEEATFGSVIACRAIRAAHCLTSIQFSPTSEHLLLAYGRRHSSLLKSVVIDEDKQISIYTILEIYRVSDMELIRILPSAEDEVNVACFHPTVASGLVYGTKEGKLRIFQCDVSNSLKDRRSIPDVNMVEVSTYEP